MPALATITSVETEVRAANKSKMLMQFDLPRPTVIIRPLREEDNIALEWHGGHDLRRFYYGQWMAHEIGEAVVLVADFNGFPVGQTAIYWQGKPAHPTIPDLQSLRVHPIFQGQGIATRLLDAGAILVKERGFSQIGLSVNPENLRAHHLYERCGYRISSEPYEDSWQYTNAVEEIIIVKETILDMVREL